MICLTLRSARLAPDPDVEWSRLPFFPPRTERHTAEISVLPGQGFVVGSVDFRLIE
jgi:hypothetical protein